MVAMSSTIEQTSESVEAQAARIAVEETRPLIVFSMVLATIGVVVVCGSFFVGLLVGIIVCKVG